jgi:hypothetical protein
VGIADVHVIVAEARGHHHLTRINHLVGRHTSQVGGLAHSGEALALDQ